MVDNVPEYPNPVEMPDPNSVGNALLGNATEDISSVKTAAIYPPATALPECTSENLGLADPLANMHLAAR